LSDGSELQVWAEFAPNWPRHIREGGGWVSDGGRVLRVHLPLPLRERAMKEGAPAETIKVSSDKKMSDIKIPAVVPETRRK
jgi:hypothetical protein